VDSAQEDKGALSFPFGLGVALVAYGIAETRPVTFALDTQGVVRKDFWRVRRVPVQNVERVCRVVTEGRVRVALRSRSSSLLTLDDEFADEDKTRFLEALGRSIAPHGISVEDSPKMPREMFGFMDWGAIRRTGEHRRRASAWAVLLGGFGFLFALLGIVLARALQGGQGFLPFFLVVAVLVIGLMAVSILSQRDSFFAAAVLVFGVFAFFLGLYPHWAPPLWPGSNPQNAALGIRAYLLLGGSACLLIFWLLRVESRKKRLRAVH